MFKFRIVPLVPIKIWKRPKIWVFSDLLYKCKESCWNVDVSWTFPASWSSVHQSRLAVPLLRMSLRNDKLPISSSLHFLTSLYMASVSLSTTNSVVIASGCLIFLTTHSWSTPSTCSPLTATKISFSLRPALAAGLPESTSLMTWSEIRRGKRLMWRHTLASLKTLECTGKANCQNCASDWDHFPVCNTSMEDVS